MVGVDNAAPKCVLCEPQLILKEFIIMASVDIHKWQ